MEEIWRRLIQPRIIRWIRIQEMHYAGKTAGNEENIACGCKVKHSATHSSSSTLHETNILRDNSDCPARASGR